MSVDIMMQCAEEKTVGRFANCPNEINKTSNGEISRRLGDRSRPVPTGVDEKAGAEIGRIGRSLIGLV